jgi:hypothetical protein
MRLSRFRDAILVGPRHGSLVGCWTTNVELQTGADLNAPTPFAPLLFLRPVNSYSTCIPSGGPRERQGGGENFNGFEAQTWLGLFGANTFALWLMAEAFNQALAMASPKSEEILKLL